MVTLPQPGPAGTRKGFHSRYEQHPAIMHTGVTAKVHTLQCIKHGEIATQIPMTDDSLQSKVVTLTRRLIEQAETGFQVSIPAPVLRFDLTGRAAGMVVFYPSGALIRFNQKMLVENGQPFLEQTVPHEVAHLVARTLHGTHIRPHGPEWKSIMAFFGALPHRCHNFITASSQRRHMRYFHYRCDCREHRLSAVRHNRCRSGVTYLCRLCGSPLFCKTPT